MNTSAPCNGSAPHTFRTVTGAPARRTLLATLTLPHTLEGIWKRARKELRGELESLFLTQTLCRVPRPSGEEREPPLRQAAQQKLQGLLGLTLIPFQSREKLKDDAPCVFTHYLSHQVNAVSQPLCVHSAYPSLSPKDCSLCSLC